MKLIKSWRWFGNRDAVKLHWLAEMGVKEVVTSLHEIPEGAVWPKKDILRTKKQIEASALRWSVVESLPVSEAIKYGGGQRERHIQNYKVSLQNLAQCGIKTVVYNFMPVLDWVRTDIHFRLPSGGESMLFDWVTFAAFDVFILERPDAEKDYLPDILQKAGIIFRNMEKDKAERLMYDILVLTQGFVKERPDISVKDYKKFYLDSLQRYKGTGHKKLRENLSIFLSEVVPVAEKIGINLAIHPDDPPFPVLGLPRIFSTIEDIEWLQNVNSSLNNGMAFCAGSFSARKENDVIEMARKYGHRIHFVHLRNTQLMDDGSFYESGHLEGRVDMVLLVKVLLEEMQKRRAAGRIDCHIPMRPDHGIKILNDFNLKGNPGYPLVGRLMGLAEIAGIEKALLSGTL